MAYRFLFSLLFLFQFSNAQVFMPSLAANANARNTLMLDYQIYSTHAGNGTTSQYAANPTTKAEFDKLFNTGFSHTTLHASGKANNLILLDWDNYTDLTTAGINIPNSGNYFAIKVSGTFIPLETGTYTFTIDADDGVDLSIDNATIVSYYGIHGLGVSTLGTYTATYSMVAGRSYRFEVRMQEAAGGEGLRFYWKPPSASGAESGGYKKNFIQYPDEMIRDRFFDGSSAQRAAPSAQYIKNLTNTNTDGVYWINLPVVGPTQIFCIMNSVVDGGGWMMMMKATTGSTFQYSSPHWTTVSTLNPSDNSQSNADAKFNTMNYFPAKDLLALFPEVLPNYAGSTTGGSINLAGTSYNCWTWLQNNFNSGIRIIPINFWNTVNRLFLRDANTFAGKGTVFSSQSSVRFYGFNYSNTSLGGASDSFTSVRWGFAWNENNSPPLLFGQSGVNETSPDVSGGIGLSSGTRLGTFSAGDQIACCQDFTGMNRMARVEIYVR